MPNGVLSILKQMAEGEAIPAERIQQALIAFNDREWQVRSALRAIDFERMARELGFTLMTAHNLEAICSDKLDLRRQIQAEINFYGQRGVRPNKAKLKNFVKAIVRLNTMIEQIEKVVNVRAKERT